MRLLVSCIPYDGGKSGISVYTREVVRGLRAQGHELALLCEPGEDGDVRAPRWTRRPVLSMLWHLFVLPFWIRRNRSRFDGFVICAANRRVCAFYPLPTVATIHDLANFHVPGKYSRLRMFYLARVLPHFAKKAHRLVSVSGATKADMVKFWHCRPEDVTVLYNGVAPGGRVSSRAAFSAGGDARPPASILYISRIEHPGKNHVRLIEAYSRLPDDLAAAHPLVIAGADWKDAEVVHAAAAASPHAAHIRFTGFVPDGEMERLWSEAGFYVFPSLFEGFGLSLVEAMARGIPCACSSNGSLGEIAADAAVTFDPESTDAIAAALKRLLEETDDERSARIERGRKRAAEFSWADHAAGIAKLLEDARTVRMFGIPVAAIAEAEAVERIIALAKERRAATVATLNVDFVANAVGAWPFKGDKELWDYLKSADLVTADGMPIVALSRLKGRPLPGRVTGADMVPAICRRCSDEGLSVYVLGGDKEAVDEAFAKMSCGVKVVGVDSAFVKLDEDQPEIAERINAARPDVLFVALGNPKQELWIKRNAGRVDIGVAIGVGGTFNFIAGRVKRAPKWMQRCGLEWIYRIMQEPGRLWRRYAYGLVKFSWLAAKEILIDRGKQ
ncbi:MAG: WecB/TagA/CpsF family glycosyltransferase [Kiritimatiellae bacterium]|nr:WecB/TagA/CpsF family glycosyltransferase [Kiritimatiellia bacterium]